MHINLTFGDMAIEFSIAVIAGALLVWFPWLVRSARALWDERSASARRRRLHRLSQELEWYERLLNSPLEYQARAFLLLGMLLFSGLCALLSIVMGLFALEIDVHQALIPRYSSLPVSLPGIHS